MGKKRRTGKKKLFQPGWSAGYQQYRHGAKQDIKLAGGPRLQPLFRGDKRKHVVSEIMDMLRDWRLSPFEHEAATTQALRSGLCLKGHGWPLSDMEASALVAEAFFLLGPERPSWEAGQPDYVEPRENCRWCRRPVGPYRSGLCSAHCATMWIMHREYQDDARTDAMRRKATKLLSKERHAPRACKHCGTSFRPWSSAVEASFCSKPCMYAWRDSEAAARHEKTCDWCGGAFRAKTAAARFCKPLCQLQESRMRTGKAIPKKISPPVFDFVFHVHSFRPRLNETRFDTVFALAA